MTTIGRVTAPLTAMTSVVAAATTAPGAPVPLTTVGQAEISSVAFAQLSGIITNEGDVTVASTVGVTVSEPVNAGSGNVSLTSLAINVDGEPGGMIRGDSGTILCAPCNFPLGSEGLGHSFDGSNVTFDAPVPATTVTLGSDGPGGVGMTDDELDTVNADSITVGGANTGALQVTGPISRSDPTDITLSSSLDIFIFDPATIDTGGGTLTFDPGMSLKPFSTGVDAIASMINFTSGSGLELRIEGPTPNTQHDQLNLAGEIDLTETVLLLTGSYVPTGSDSFLILNNDGADPIIGAFNGLPEGAPLTVNGVEMRITYEGGDGNDVVLLPATGGGNVVSRHLFYNNSAFDTVSDDDAIANKVALMPGIPSSFANFSSYVLGINGVMIDIDGLANSAGIDSSDFTFRTGNVDDTSTWVATTTPTVSVRAAEGAGGSDRIVLIWPDGDISDTWLEVTVLANADTGRAADDVFYFGNLIGDAGGDGQTTGNDFMAVLANPANFLNPAAVDNLFDLNRDARVNAADMLIVRDHATGASGGLPMITPTGNSFQKSGPKTIELRGDDDQDASRSSSRPSPTEWLLEQADDALIRILQEYAAGSDWEVEIDSHRPASTVELEPIDLEWVGVE